MKYLLIMIVTLCSLSSSENDEPLSPKVDFITDNIPPWDRIKIRCGIPIHEEWSNEMRLKYSKQIELQIKKYKQNESRSKRKNKR